MPAGRMSHRLPTARPVSIELRACRSLRTYLPLDVFRYCKSITSMMMFAFLTPRLRAHAQQTGRGALITGTLAVVPEWAEANESAAATDCGQFVSVHELTLES